MVERNTTEKHKNRPIQFIAAMGTENSILLLADQGITVVRTVTVTVGFLHA